MAVAKYESVKGAKRYKATVWNGNKPLRSKSFHRKIDADEWHRRQVLDIQDQRVGRLKGSRTSLSEFYQETYVSNSGVRESSLVDYERIFRTHLEPKFGSRNLDSISEVEWATHFNDLKTSGMSGARLNRVHAVASAVYSLGIKWKFFGANPLLLVDWEMEGLKGFPLVSGSRTDPEFSASGL